MISISIAYTVNIVKGATKRQCISLEHTDYSKIVANRFCELFIIRLYEIMIVTVWQIGPPQKRETLMLNSEKGRNRPKSEEPVQGLWKRTVKKILSENPLDQEVFIDFHHETLGGFLCIFFRW